MVVQALAGSRVSPLSRRATAPSKSAAIAGICPRLRRPLGNGGIESVDGNQPCPDAARHHGQRRRFDALVIRARAEGEQEQRGDEGQRARRGQHAARRTRHAVHAAGAAAARDDDGERGDGDEMPEQQADRGCQRHRQQRPGGTPDEGPRRQRRCVPPERQVGQADDREDCAGRQRCGAASDHAGPAAGCGGRQHQQPDSPRSSPHRTAPRGRPPRRSHRGRR